MSARLLLFCERSRSRKDKTQASEHHKVRITPDALDPPNAQEREPLPDSPDPE